MLKKTTALILTSALMATAVSCGSVPEETTVTTSEETSEATTEATTATTTENTEPEPDESSAGFDPSQPWCQAYLEALPGIFEDPSYLDMLTYTLIYLDGDDIPEVFIEGDCEAAGEIVLTYHDGEVCELWLPRLGTQYIPGTGLLYTCTGHMDYYPVTITCLNDGSFDLVAEGDYYMSEETYAALAEDPDAEIVYTYEWDGVEITEEEFEDHIAEYYDMDNSVYPDNFYSYGDFQTLLTTGEW